MEKQGKHILKNLKIQMLSLMRVFPCDLQPHA